jgi:hypothetical protein
MICDHDNVFLQIPTTCSPYLRKVFLPKLFVVIDSKKDNVIDIEEYISAIAMFRVGTLDEKIRGRCYCKRLYRCLAYCWNTLLSVLFMMYEPAKGGILTRSVDECGTRLCR